MASLFPLKPAHAPVKAYYAALKTFHQHGHKSPSPLGLAQNRRCLCFPSVVLDFGSIYLLRLSKPNKTIYLTVVGLHEVANLTQQRIGQVITVSLETQQIIATLPSLNFPTP